MTDTTAGEHTDGLTPEPDTETAAPKRRGPGRPPGSKNKPKRDRAPRAAKPKPAAAPAKAKPTTSQLRDGLAEILTLPGIPCSMIGDQWAANHFFQTGPQLADTLASQSEKYPALRGVLERIVNGESAAVLLMALGGYLIPPLAHWGLAPQMLALPFGGAPAARSEAERVFVAPPAPPEQPPAAATSSADDVPRPVDISATVGPIIAAGLDREFDLPAPVNGVAPPGLFASTQPTGDLDRLADDGGPA